MSKWDCPRCGGPIPNELHKGQYPGALSRADNKTEICSDCGHEEAWEQMQGRLRPRELWQSYVAWKVANSLVRVLSNRVLSDE